MIPLAPIVPVTINIPWTDVYHVLDIGSLVALVDFILDNRGLTLSLLDEKPLVSVRPKYDYLLVSLILPQQVSIIFILKLFSVKSSMSTMTYIVYQTLKTFCMYFLKISGLLYTPMGSPWYL